VCFSSDDLDGDSVRGRNSGDLMRWVDLISASVLLARHSSETHLLLLVLVVGRLHHPTSQAFLHQSSKLSREEGEEGRRGALLVTRQVDPQLQSHRVLAPFGVDGHFGMDDPPSSDHPLQVAWLEETSVAGKVLEGGRRQEDRRIGGFVKKTFQRERGERKKRTSCSNWPSSRYVAVDIPRCG
jgi:hypothetical protein